MNFLCSDSYENGITKEKVLTKGSGKLPFSEYLRFQSNGLWNFQSVKYLDELVQQYGGRKRGGREAEFQERIRKEWACLHRGASFLGFRFHCPSVFKVVGPTRKIQSSSKLWQVLKMIKIISYVVIAFCYRKENILCRWSNILRIFYGNEGLCQGCRSYWFGWKLGLLHTAFEQLLCLNLCCVSVQVHCRNLVAVQCINTQTFAFFLDWLTTCTYWTAQWLGHCWRWLTQTELADWQ